MHTWRTLLLAAVAPLASACGFFVDGEPEIMAHRAAGGRWPQNSRSAVTGSLAAGYPGIEVDLGLTRDDALVLMHDPWVSAPLCRRADGGEVPERVLLRDLTLTELERDYRCAAGEDPEHPEVTPTDDPPMTLDELLARLEGHPEVALYLDVKYDPDDTGPAERFADAMRASFERAQLPERVYVETTLPAAAEAMADVPGATLVWGWPRFTPDDSDTAAALAGEAELALGLTSFTDEARAARAHGITLPYQLLHTPSVMAARDDGLLVFVYTANTQGELDTLCDYPIDFLMTDLPERAPCLR